MKPSQLIRRIRQIFITLLRSKEGDTSETEITELELLEAFQITEQVVISRLKGNPREWKGDEKRKFSFLFKSIRTEAQEAIRDYFTTDGVPARGVSINKYNTVILDAIFELLQAVGPERAPKLMTKLREAAARDMRNMRETHADDVIVAKALLVRYGKERAQKVRAPKKMTKGERLAAIEVAVLNLQFA